MIKKVQTGAATFLKTNYHLRNIQVKIKEPIVQPQITIIDTMKL